MSRPADPASPYSSAAHMVYNQLPRILPPLGDAPADGRTLFMMPLSSIHLCYCTEVRQALLRNSSGRRRRIAKLNLRNETERLQSFISSSPEAALLSERYSSRTLMRDALLWPRKTTGTISCPAYARAVAWVTSTTTWREAPERHLWVYPYPHFLRAALQTELAHAGRAISLFSRMAMGCLLAPEDRGGDWRAARALGHFVAIPFYDPPVFRYDAAGGCADKDVLIAESSGHPVSCHRFDGSQHGRSHWSCVDPGLQLSAAVRPGLARACHGLNASSSIRLNLVTDGRFALGSRAASAANARAKDVLSTKARLYKRSVFCAVAPCAAAHPDASHPAIC